MTTPRRNLLCFYELHKIDLFLAIIRILGGHVLSNEKPRPCMCVVALAVVFLKNMKFHLFVEQKIIVVSLIQAEITKFEVSTEPQNFASIWAHFTTNIMKTMKFSALIFNFLNYSKINCRVVICVAFYENTLSQVIIERIRTESDAF